MVEHATIPEVTGNERTSGTSPAPAAVIRSLISQELGAAPEQLFATFDDVPLRDGPAVVI